MAARAAAVVQAIAAGASRALQTRTTMRTCSFLKRGRGSLGRHTPGMAGCRRRRPRGERRAGWPARAAACLAQHSRRSMQQRRRRPGTHGERMPHRHHIAIIISSSSRTPCCSSSRLPCRPRGAPARGRSAPPTSGGPGPPTPPAASAPCQSAPCCAARRAGSRAAARARSSLGLQTTRCMWSTRAAASGGARSSPRRAGTRSE